tara:strand:+ start:236 stop:442 length:207 start_codon:yes stop_codon:yes gene_type:complete
VYLKENNMKLLITIALVIAFPDTSYANQSEKDLYSYSEIKKKKKKKKKLAEKGKKKKKGFFSKAFGSK